MELSQQFAAGRHHLGLAHGGSEGWEGRAWVPACSPVTGEEGGTCE